ncbi:MAG TPA: hypothetical protein VK272_05755 [Solirubrobacteraceae bacterium]|nr:hypothetical protein [Solirubrobacteraceae bacterium]
MSPVISPMAPLLVVLVFWILTLTVVAGLCFGARLGDEQTLDELLAQAEPTVRHREWRAEPRHADARAEPRATRLQHAPRPGEAFRQPA